MDGASQYHVFTKSTKNNLTDIKYKEKLGKNPRPQMGFEPTTLRVLNNLKRFLRRWFPAKKPFFSSIYWVARGKLVLKWVSR